MQTHSLQAVLLAWVQKYRDFLLISDMSLQSPFTTNPEHILYTKMIHLSPKELFMLKEV